jgi:hypothetical protein
VALGLKRPLLVLVVMKPGFVSLTVTPPQSFGAVEDPQRADDRVPSVRDERLEIHFLAVF